MLVISGWNSSGCNSWLIRLPWCCWWSGSFMCSCILIITDLPSVFPVLLFALKVCVPHDGSHSVIFNSFSPFYSSSICSCLASLLHSSHLGPAWVQCLFAVAYETEEQANFRRFPPDQNARLIRMLIAFCSIQQPSNIDTLLWAKFYKMSGLTPSEVFWNDSCCKLIYWSAKLNTVSPIILKLSWCADVCHNQIKDSNLDMTGCKRHVVGFF